MKIKLILFVAFLTSVATFSQKQWTLKEAVNEALEKNISIQQNKLFLELAKKDVEIAKGNFLPNFNGNTSGSFNFGTGFDPVSQDRVNTSFFGGSMNVNSGITVFSGYRNSNVYKQSKLGVESSLLDLQKIENDVALFVVNGFLNVLFAKENLEAAKVQADISKTQIEAAELRFKNGVIPKGDLLNIQSTAASDAQTVITQENALDIALLNLSQLLQVPVEGFDIAPINVDLPSANLFYKTSNEVYEKSLNNMPEIARAKLAIESSEFDIEIAKGAFFPTLSASIGASTNYGFNLNLPDGVSNPSISTQLSENFGYGFGFNLSIPIFNRFQTKNRVAQQVINKQISETRLTSVQIELQQTIEQAFLDVKSALKTYEAAKVSLEAQEEAFKNAQESYNFGTMTQFDFDQVRTRLVNAQAALIRSKYDYVFKTKVLQFYSGELVLE